MTTYMIFPENVAVMDLGSKAYAGKIESGNMLYLKPLKANPAPSSLLVRTTRDRIYLHYIAYRQRPDHLFWDYRTDTLDDASPLGATTNQQVYTGQLDRLKKQRKRKLGSYASSGMKMTLTRLAVDDAAVYVLLEIQNSTSIPYKLGYLSFTYKERHARKSRRKISPEEILVEPLAQEASSQVPAHSKASLAYALPLFAGTRRGFMEIVIRENEGNRLLTGTVRAQKIAQSPYLSSFGSAYKVKPAPRNSSSIFQSHVFQTHLRKDHP